MYVAPTNDQIRGQGEVSVNQTVVNILKKDHAVNIDHYYADTQMAWYTSC